MCHNARCKKYKIRFICRFKSALFVNTTIYILVTENFEEGIEIIKLVIKKLASHPKNCTEIYTSHHLLWILCIFVMDIVHNCKIPKLSWYSCATERTWFDSRQGEKNFLIPKIVHSGSGDHRAS